MIDLTKPLDLDDAGAAAFLKQLQGNILKSHGREHAVHILVRFHTGYRKTARVWLALFVNKYVTSAHKQREDAQLKDEQQQLFAMLFLSAAGYRALGIAADKIPHDGSARFQQGMKASAVALGDQPQQWSPPYNEEIHAIILLAHKVEESLQHEAAAIRRQLRRFCELVQDEVGIRLPMNTEHFGYFDGISQPLFIQQEIAREIQERGNQRWNPSANLDLVLVEEPGGKQTYGSFMVFRKLQQHVEQYNAAVNTLAAELGAPDVTVAQASALIMGRSTEGIPLIKTSVINPQAKPNDFTYDVDPQGMICPLHAHIRKANPRNAANKDDQRIVRRGMPYQGEPSKNNGGNGWQTRDAVPPLEKGMLFMSFQARLENFERIQRQLNDVDFPNAATGIDPIAGWQNGQAVAQHWPQGDNVIDFTVGPLTTLKGGEYFFAPSLPTLQELASIDLAVLQLTPSQQQRFQAAAERILTNEDDALRVGDLWKQNRRIDAVGLVGIQPDDFDAFYAYLVPLLPFLDANTVARSAGAIPTLTPDQQTRFQRAFTALFDPEKLQIFAETWPNDPAAALAPFGVSTDEASLLYTYLGNFGIVLNLHMWL
ncbi:MAG: Dyp-type peroxidase [Caldilineaceae bacterium]|nr:Dyp-type peroxidase [Caldilineaceae bacterium]